MRRDLLYAFRNLRKNPGYGFIVILTLALGIGATTTVFSVFYAVLLRSLPYESPEQLVMIWNRYEKMNMLKAYISPPDFLDRKRESRSLQQMAAIEEASVTLLGKGEPQRLRASRVSASLFSTLGVSPMIGRDFLQEEDQPGKETVAILSYNFWKRQFASDRRIIGQSLNLGGTPHIVIGVMPKGFWFPDPETELWTPIAFTADQKADAFRGNESLTMVARMKPGIPLEKVQAEMDAIAAGVLVRVPDRREFLSNAGWGATVVSLRDSFLGNVKPALLALMGAVLFLLLIGCANVVNIILMRTGSREKEIAIRTVLGGGRFTMIRLLFAEALVLAFAGGIVGVILALAATSVLPSIAPESLPRVDEIAIDRTVLLFTFGVSLLTALFIGMVPAFRVSLFCPYQSLKTEGTSTATKSVHQFRNLLVITEIALALMLMTGAALLIKSFQKLNSVDTGFRTENRVAFTISLPMVHYSEDSQMVNFYERLREQIQALPGINSVGANASLPIAEHNWTATFAIEEKPLQPGEPEPVFEYRIVTPNYFRAMGIPFLTGRDFHQQDTADSPRVAIIDERLAERYWKNQNPIGKRIGFSNANSVRWREVIGVVRHVKNAGPKEEGVEQIYFPISQIPQTTMTMVVHSNQNPTALIAAIRERVRLLDPDLPIYKISTLEHILSSSIAQPRFNMLLFVLFAITALALAGIGVYGVLSYSVAQRKKEIGIRMAIGALPQNVLHMIIRQSLAVCCAGLLLGILGSLLLSRFLQSLLFQLQGFEPALYGASVILALAVTLIAATIPARRAATIDPLRALREE